MQAPRRVATLPIAAMLIITSMLCAKPTNGEGAVVEECNRLSQKFSRNGSNSPIDLSDTYNALRNAREQAGAKLSPDQSKLLDPERVMKRMNGVLSRVAPVVERADARKKSFSSVRDAIDELPTSRDQSGTRQCCPGGGNPMGTYTICEIRDSFNDIAVTLDSVYDTVQSTQDCCSSVYDAVNNLSLSVQQDCCSCIEPVLSIVEETNSIVEQTNSIVETLCNTCDACIRQADIDAAPSGTYTISSGGTYCVAENLTAVGSGAVINITSGSVTLDLHGHTIDGNATASSCVNINHGATTGAVTVKNGNVTNAVDGIYVYDSQHWLIKDMYTLANSQNGVHVYALSPGATKNGVIDSVIADDNTDNGIYLNGPDANNNQEINIANSFARNNGNRGFNLRLANLCTLRNCVASGNSAEGIYVIDSTVDNCVAIANNVGFLITSSSTAKNCVASKSASHGFYIGTAAFPSTVRECTAIHNGIDGMSSGFYASGDSAIITNCISIDTQTSGSSEFEFGKSSVASSNIAHVHQDGVTGFLFSENNETNSATVVKNCIALGDSYSTGVGFDDTTTDLTDGSITFADCIAGNFQYGFHLQGDRDSITVRNCSATHCLWGFRTTNDCPTLFRDCTVTGGTDFILWIGFETADTTNVYKKLIERCNAVGYGLEGSSYGFFVNQSSVTLRGNTATGWARGFYDTSASAGFFNNLGCKNQSNFSGVNPAKYLVALGPVTVGSHCYWSNASSS